MQGYVTLVTFFPKNISHRATQTLKKTRSLGCEGSRTAEAEEKKKGIVEKGSETCQRFAREICKAKRGGGKNVTAN